MRIDRVRLVLAAAGTLAMLGCDYLSPKYPPPPRTVKAEVSVETLQARSDAWLDREDSEIPPEAGDDFFALADALLAKGKEDAALGYIEAGLRLRPMALEYQVLYAELLGARGRAEEAKHHAMRVINTTESGELYDRAMKAMGLPGLGGVYFLGHNAPAREETLVLSPIGPFDRPVLTELAASLMVALPMPVEIMEYMPQMPWPGRTPFDRYVGELREGLISLMREDIFLESYLQRRGITRDQLNFEHVVIDASRMVAFRSGGEAELFEFDEHLERMKSLPPQYAIEDLKTRFKGVAHSPQKLRRYYVLVSRIDAYLDEGDKFVFGTGEFGGRYAVLPYLRFTAEFNGEEPSRKRLVQRMRKQVLSSVGFMLGVERCNDPLCARAFPKNLAMHDAKRDTLCKDCLAAIRAALKKS